MFDFVGNRKILLGIPLVAIAVGIVFLFIFGVDMDIQFKGGSIITYSYEGEISGASVKSAVEGALSGEKVNIQQTEDIGTGRKNVVVTLAAARGLTVEQQAAVSEALKTAFPDNNLTEISSSNVNPVIGREFFLKSLVAVAFAALLMMVYVAFRFSKIGGWSVGATAVIALMVDVSMIFFTFVILRIPLNDNFIAVVLTILGYSLNDTIVIYDRVRENENYGLLKEGYAVLVNKSINQSLVRSINTSVTTILALTVITVVAVVYGITSIISFSLPLIVGMTVGLYTSLCVSGPLWTIWQERKKA